MSDAHRFRATLRSSPEHGRATWIVVPFDVREAFGTGGRVPVTGTIEGVEFRSSISPMKKGGGPGAHMLPVNAELRRRAGLEAGQDVEIELRRDERPREVSVPDDFQAALESSPKAKSTWTILSFTHRKEPVRSIEEAKRPETRRRRIEKAVAMLEAGKKNP